MTGRGRWITLGLLAAAALGGAWLLHRAGAPPASRVTVLAEGLCAPGAELLLSDLIELQNRQIILPPGGALPKGTHTLRVHLSRQGDRLDLRAELDGGALPSQSGPPSEAFAGLARALALLPPDPTLIPVDATEAWELLDLAGRTQDEASAPLVDRAATLVRKEPGCALARLAYATLLTRYLVEHVDVDTMEAQSTCERNFQDGLATLPGYPRLAALFAIHLSDLGRQREALGLLEDGLRRHPGNLSLLNALAYAARTSGQLELADRALDRRAALSGQPRGQASLADNTMLYRGRYSGFESELQALPEGPIKTFYGGYVRLLRGDSAGARTKFTPSESGGLGSTLFVRLSQIYVLALDGRGGEARAALDALEAERTRIHLPDGEFTFKVAETYGFLGDPGKALDVAERASVQGFGCADWFERAPFLAGARKLPKWRSLDQHLREREKLLGDAFPPSAFGL